MRSGNRNSKAGKPVLLPLFIIFHATMRKVFCVAVCVLLGLDAPAQNVKISDFNSPCEPSIIIDPRHPNILVAASNIDNYYTSQDTGRTWTYRKAKSTYGVWGDPAFAVDTGGNFYYFHLSNPASGNWIDRIVCQKSTDKGQTWNNGSYTGLNGKKAQDKEWAIVDRKTNNICVTWSQFDEYGSTKPGDSSIILFSKSTDTGYTWSNPVRINQVAGDCIDDDNTVMGATPAIGPNGEIYVAWALGDAIVFNMSKDAGKTWLNKEVKIADIPGGWNYLIGGLMRANGLPVMVCDTTNGPNRGTIYINWSDQRNGTSNTDVFLIRSTDGGKTWSAPARVNDDASQKHQFLTWMTIDPVSGYLYFVFYDRRNYTDASTDVYAAVSKDGGKTFINRRISESPFKASPSIFFGDYTNITAYDGVIRPIWTRMDAGALSVWTDMTTLEDITTEVPEIRINQGDEIDASNYPNPAQHSAYVAFKLRGPSTVSLYVYNLQGQLLQRVIDNKQMSNGKYVEKIDFNALGMKPGSYFIRLSVNGKTRTLKMIVVD